VLKSNVTASFSLYRIDKDGSSQPCRYCALGSGGPNALAVLEAVIDGSKAMSTEEALTVVRRAVRSGIVNDLGSGSHVDLCIVSANGIERCVYMHLFSIVSLSISSYLA
jgi:20S proteasome subunit beta 2